MKLNKIRPAGVKGGIQYYFDEYGNCFCDALDQSGKVGGGYEIERNEVENPIRLERVHEQLVGNVLDYGCGNGMLVKYLNDNGIKCDGYDKYNENFNKIDLSKKYNLITMVEVIEHLSSPYDELDEIFNLLASNGKLIIETSFMDWMEFEEAYIEPSVGHSTIWTHEGLNHMMLSKGFTEGEHINRNVRIYTKL